MIVVSKSADFPSLLTLIAAIAGTGGPLLRSYAALLLPFTLYRLPESLCTSAAIADAGEIPADSFIYYSIVCIFTCCQADYPFIITLY